MPVPLLVGASELLLLHQEVTSILREKRLVGAQIAVTHKGKMLTNLSVGDSPSTVFTSEQYTIIWSCSKIIESLVIAMLVHRGLISYSDKLQTHIPDFYSPVVTVSDLMKHRAGSNVLVTKLSTTKELVDISHDVGRLTKLVHTNLNKDFDVRQPTRTAYHAVTRGFFTQLIVYKVTGKMFNAFVQENICEPLRAKNVVLQFGCPPELKTKMVKVTSRQSLPGLLRKLFLAKIGITRLLEPSNAVAKEKFYRNALTPPDVALLAKFMNTKSAVRDTLEICADQPFNILKQANNSLFLEVESPSSHAICNAESFAWVLDELAKGGGMILSQQSLELAMQHDPELVFDEGLMNSFCYTNSGWGCQFEKVSLPLFSDLEDWVGWFGAGQEIAMFNPKLQATFVYFPSSLEPSLHYHNAFRCLSVVSRELKAKGE
jgi:CubicO group peptidase (beta-lactamase class C family)